MEDTDNKTIPSEKEKFFRTINDFILTSGVIATGIKTFTKGISTQVEQTKKETEKQVLTFGLISVGAVFLFIGAIQVLTYYLDLSLYNNLVIGGFLLISGLLIKMLKR